MSLPTLTNAATLPTAAAATLSTATTAIGALGGLILAVTPSQTKGYQPQNPPYPDGSQDIGQQPPSFLFNYEGEQTATLESEITDEWVEDNTAIQDQIALKPVIITTHGFISELNNIAPPLLQGLQSIANALTSIEAYAPGLSVTANEAYNEAFQLYQVAINAATTAISAVASIVGIGGETVITGNSPINVLPLQTKQAAAFQLFYGYWLSRTLFTVQTPWAVFQNMAIMRLRTIQGEDSLTYTDFEVTFKQMRFSYTLTSSSAGTLISQNRLSQQSAGINNQGVSTPSSSISLSQGLAQ